MDLCNIGYVKGLLAKHGFHFSKTLGQNFLTESWVPVQTASMCGASESVGVLEIGPGIGTLTRPLADVTSQIVSVEIDKALLPILDETLSDLDNVKIVSGDIMKLDIKQLISENFSCQQIVACANLPYYITTPILTLLLESGCFESITVMVQKEVAERITAKAGTRDYGSFTVFVNYHASSEILFDVPSTCFIPQPKVDSAVIKITPRKLDFEIKDSKLYFKVVRAAFGTRRKTLVNSLLNGLGDKLSKTDITQALEACGFISNIRGECLSPSDFAKLSNYFFDFAKTVVEK